MVPHKPGKRPPVRPLADLVEGCIQPVLAAQGFATGDIVTAWPEIVGARLAPWCEAVKLEWPRRRKDLDDPDSVPDPATLVVRVEGAFALEIQHLAPVLIERVNTRYGWRCVGRIVLKQAPVRRPPPKPAELPPPDRASVAAATAAVGGVADDALKDALVRLGAGIIASKKRMANGE